MILKTKLSSNLWVMLETSLFRELYYMENFNLFWKLVNQRKETFVLPFPEVKWKPPSHVQLFVSPWTIQSMAFSRPESWSGEPVPSPGDLPNPEIEPRSPTFRADSLPAEPWGRQLSHKGSPRILEQVACPFLRGSSRSRNWTGVSYIAGGFFIN